MVSLDGSEDGVVACSCGVVVSQSQEPAASRDHKSQVSSSSIFHIYIYIAPCVCFPLSAAVKRGGDGE